MGEPTIEFPLRGHLIQDYGHCVIISRNGLVVSIRNDEDASAAKEMLSEEAKAEAVAMHLLKKAKEGDVIAQYRLAYCYQTGKGVPRNPDECVRWYTIAAMSGHPASQHNLGVLYMNGDGVEKDYEQAYTWGVLAAENGNTTLTKELRPRLTDEQELSGRLRAWRIRDGLEPLPYCMPENSAPIAKKESSRSSAASEN
ncbi:MAG TPA: tetratricopeptide repeat protein [Pontiella sp.]|nr:tetratricopeptide repeat protein [Pontiella sp.]